MTPETLDALLDRWAATYRLSDADVDSLRRAAMRDKEDEIDTEWLWDLMRPVARLLDGPRPLIETLMRGYA